MKQEKVEYDKMFLMGYEGIVSIAFFAMVVLLALVSWAKKNLLLVLIAILFMAISSIAFGLEVKEVYIKREPKKIIELKEENK